MPSITVNGQAYQFEKDKTLLRFLREDLRLCGTKDGCSEGACGACTVIIDGRKSRACTQRLSRLEGKNIITIEGLTDREKRIFSYCFAEAGAVQCGYCIPGMVLSAKALLDKNPSPSREDVKQAIKGNICRCTGYVKIENAILMAAGFYQSGELPDVKAQDGLLGHRIQRIDAAEKCLGTGVYVGDMHLPGMLACKVLRAPAPRCRIIRIDSEEARRNPKCVRIITAADVPYNKHGHIVPDWDVLIPEGECTRYVGDAIAIAVAATEEDAAETLSQIRLEYETLEPVTSVEQALAADAPLVHEGGNLLSEVRVHFGDPDKALESSAYVVRRVFHTPFTEHAFMEPECAVAQCEGDDVVVYTSGQSVFDEQREIARMLCLPKDKVRCISRLVGGGFGGKEDMSVQHHAALAAWLLKRPVKLRLTRQESINVHPKRHPMDMDFTVGCDKSGRLTGMKAVLITDNGAYASLGHPVLERACTHAAGPYNYHNVDIVGRAVYTNNVPCGAFRGFGVTQSCFALECCINLLAEKAGIDPFDFRMLNAIRPGDVLPNGQIAGLDTALVQCLEGVRAAYKQDPMAGIACSMKNTGVGVGLEDAGRCRIRVIDGKAHLYCSAACMGQGFATVALIMAVQTTGLDPDCFVIASPDTAQTPDCGTSTASRQTAITGEAIRRACLKLKAALDDEQKREGLGSGERNAAVSEADASEPVSSESAAYEDEPSRPGDCSGKGRGYAEKAARALGRLEGREFFDSFVVKTDPVGSRKPNPESHLAYSYSAQVVSLDEEMMVGRITAVCDSGVVVNPTAIEGQVEGGVVMGMGYALSEDFPIEGGVPKVRYGTLGLLRATQIPEIATGFVHSDTPLQTSFGAKGIGELAALGTAPAIWHAYYRRDGKERNRLPMEDTPYRR